MSEVVGIEIWRFQNPMADSKEDEWVSGGVMEALGSGTQIFSSEDVGGASFLVGN